MKLFLLRGSAGLFFLAGLAVASAQAQGTAFTYQGQLQSNGGPATGVYDLEFSVFNAAAGGSQQGATIALNDLGVTNGLFTAVLDFGNAFSGGDRYLQIAVRPGASTGSYATLAPRQRLTPAPYSIHATTAGGITGLLPASQLPTNVAVLDRTQTFTATQTFRAPAIFNERIGVRTANPQQTLHVAGPYLRVDGVGAEQAVLGGDGAGGDVELGSSNPGVASVALFNIGSGSYMSLFARDGHFDGILSGDGSGLTTLPAGQLIGSVPDARLSANVALRAAGNYFTGDQTFADRIFFGAQTRQMLNLWGEEYGIGVQSSTTYFRSSSGFAWYRGGRHHDGEGDPGTGGVPLMRLDAAGNLMPGGWLGIGIPTPSFLIDVQGALSAGRFSTTNSPNGAVLVLRNTTPSPTYLGAVNFERNSSTVGQIGYFNNDRFGFRVADVERMTLNSSGFLGLGTATPGTQLDVLAGQGLARLTSTNTYFGSVLILNNKSAIADYLGAINFETNGTTVGQIGYLADHRIIFNAGGVERMSVQGGLLTIKGAGNEQAFIGGNGGAVEIGSRNSAVTSVRFTNPAAGPGSLMDCVAKTFQSQSDRNAKQDFRAVEPASILAKVVALPITEWTYKGEGETRHVGPVAQDFKATFGLGNSDQSIATVDADGVALAAIQGLHRKFDDEVRSLRAENAGLKERLGRLERLLSRDARE